MKIFKKTFVLILILGVLATALYFIYPNLNKNDNTSTELIKLVDLKSYELQAFDILGGEYDYHFKRNAQDTWTMSKPKAEISVTSIDNVSLEACTIYATRIIEENVKNSKLADYGLDEPITVAVTPKEGEKYTVELGNQEPTKNGYYFRMAGESTVYLMSNYKAQMLLTDFKNLCDTTLISCSMDDITGFSIKKNGKLQFDIGKIDVEWRVLAPTNCMAQDYVIEELLPLMENITVDEVFSLDPDDKKYGFNNPTYEFSLRTSDGKVQTVIIGKERTAGVFYAKNKGENSTMLLPLAKITFIDKQLKDIMSSAIYLQDITKTSKAVVTYKGIKDEIDIAYSKSEANGLVTEKEEFVFNGHDVSHLNNRSNAKLLIKEFYESFVAITWYELAYDAKPKYTKPVLKIEYTTTEGKKITIEYVRKNDDFSYYFLNGEYGGLIVDNELFANISKTRKALADEVERRNSK